MARKKEEPKVKLVLAVPDWVPAALDEHAQAAHSSRNKAAGELIINGLAVSRRTTARCRTGNATIKRRLWEVWCRLRAWYWALYYTTDETRKALDMAIAALPKQHQGGIRNTAGAYMDQMQEQFLPNLSVRVRFLLQLLATWAGADTAPEFVFNRKGRRRPCREVAEDEFKKLGRKKKLPLRDEDLEELEQEWQEAASEDVQI